MVFKTTICIKYLLRTDADHEVPNSHYLIQPHSNPLKTYCSHFTDEKRGARHWGISLPKQFMMLHSKPLDSPHDSLMQEGSINTPVIQGACA